MGVPVWRPPKDDDSDSVKVKKRAVDADQLAYNGTQTLLQSESVLFDPHTRRSVRLPLGEDWGTTLHRELPVLSMNTANVGSPSIRRRRLPPRQSISPGTRMPSEMPVTSMATTPLGAWDSAIDLVVTDMFADDRREGADGTGEGLEDIDSVFRPESGEGTYRGFDDVAPPGVFSRRAPGITPAITNTAEPSSGEILSSMMELRHARNAQRSHFARLARAPQEPLRQSVSTGSVEPSPAATTPVTATPPMAVRRFGAAFSRSLATLNAASRGRDPPNIPERSAPRSGLSQLLTSDRESVDNPQLPRPASQPSHEDLDRIARHRLSNAIHNSRLPSFDIQGVDDDERPNARPRRRTLVSPPPPLRPDDDDELPYLSRHSVHSDLLRPMADRMLPLLGQSSPEPPLRLGEGINHERMPVVSSSVSYDPSASYLHPYRRTLMSSFNNEPSSTTDSSVVTNAFTNVFSTGVHEQSRRQNHRPQVHFGPPPQDHSEVTNSRDGPVLRHTRVISRTRTPSGNWMIVRGPLEGEEGENFVEWAAVPGEHPSRRTGSTSRHGALRSLSQRQELADQAERDQREREASQRAE